MALRQASAERGGSRGATAGTDRAGCGPIVEVPRCLLSTLKAGFVSSAQAGLDTTLLAGRPRRGMECCSQAVNVDHGQLVGRRLKESPVVVDLHELSPVGRRTTGGRDETTTHSSWATWPPPGSLPTVPTSAGPPSARTAGSSSLGKASEHRCTSSTRGL